MHDDVCTIMKQENDEIVRLYPEGSFQRLFWPQKLDASRVTKASMQFIYINEIPICAVRSLVQVDYCLLKYGRLYIDWKGVDSRYEMLLN